MVQLWGLMNVLRELYLNRAGLSHNQLRFDKGISEKVLRRWLTDNPKIKDSLVSKGLVVVERRRVRGGWAKVHILTEMGVQYYERYEKPRQIWKDFEEFEVLSVQEKRAVIEIALKLLIERTFDYVRASGDVNAFILFFDAVEKPLAEFWNKDVWITDEDYTAFNLGTRTFSKAYLEHDSKLAWALGHAINKIGGLFLIKLKLQTPEAIKARNMQWEKEKGGYRLDLISDELDERKKIIARDFPALAIPEGYGTIIGDLLEYE